MATVNQKSKPHSLEQKPHDDSKNEQWYLPQIERKVLKKLMKRNDSESLKYFGIWLILLLGSGYFAVLSWGTWLALPAFFIYGTIYTGADARRHECSHGTPFKTYWLNGTFYFLTSFMTTREAYYWRWSHFRHHTDTLVGNDPEIQVTRPAQLWKIGLDFFWLNGGFNELKRLLAHAVGHVSEATQSFVLESEIKKMIWSSRIYVGLYGLILLACWIMESFLPLMLLILPQFYGHWLHQLLALTQHAGLADNVRDHRLNSRTMYLNPLFRFYYVNMNYHLEHHLFPIVPFHGLPKLHEALKDQLPAPYPNLMEVYREMMPALKQQSKEPNHCILRPLPENGGIKL